MANKKNEIVEKKPQTFSEVLTTSLVEVQDGLPSDLNITKFVQNGIALLNENDQLATFARNYGTGQIKQGMMRGAFLGLDFMSKEAYLVPYGKQLNFMIDYRGAKKLAKKYSIRPIKDIFAEVVRLGDDFSKEIIDGKTTVVFKPKPFSDADVIGAFAEVLYEDGSIQCEVMTLKELEKTRSKSKASNSMAWKDFPTEMYKKTVLHRLCKSIELDLDARQREIVNEDSAIDIDANETPDVVDPFNEETTDTEVIDVEVVESEE